MKRGRISVRYRRIFSLSRVTILSLSIQHLSPSSPLLSDGGGRRSITTSLSRISSFRFSRWKLHQHSQFRENGVAFRWTATQRIFFFLSNSPAFTDPSGKTRDSLKSEIQNIKYVCVLCVISNLIYYVLQYIMIYLIYF